MPSLAYSSVDEPSLKAMRTSGSRGSRGITDWVKCIDDRIRSRANQRKHQNRQYLNFHLKMTFKAGEIPHSIPLFFRPRPVGLYVLSAAMRAIAVAI